MEADRGPALRPARDLDRLLRGGQLDLRPFLCRYPGLRGHRLGFTLAERAEIRGQAGDAAQPSFAAAPRQRLGAYVERCFLAWLERSRCVRLIAHGAVLRDQSRTVGEADFLVERPRGAGREPSRLARREQWEISFKIYLQTGDEDDAGRWLGIDPRDTLDLRLRRLLRQLELCRHPQFVERHGEGWIARAWIGGWLVPPWSAESTGQTRAWMRIGPDGSLHREVAVALARARLRWRLLHRLEWLMPFGERDESVGMGGDAAPRTIPDSPGIWSGTDPATGGELQRLFLVDDGWPSALRCPQ